MVRDTFPLRSRPACEKAVRGLKMKAITIALRQAPKLPFASVWGQKLSIFAWALLWGKRKQSQQKKQPSQENTAGIVVRKGCATDRRDFEVRCLARATVNEKELRKKDAR